MVQCRCHILQTRNDTTLRPDGREDGLFSVTIMIIMMPVIILMIRPCTAEMATQHAHYDPVQRTMCSRSSIRAPSPVAHGGHGRPCIWDCDPAKISSEGQRMVCNMPVVVVHAAVQISHNPFMLESGTILWPRSANAAWHNDQITCMWTF